MKRYTAYLSMPETPRGHYDEEIDVVASGPTEAKRLAQEVADDPEKYEPGMKVRRVALASFLTVSSWSL